MAPALPPNDTRGPVILGVVWTFTALDIIIVALRFYDRVHLRGGLGWDVSIWSLPSALIVRRLIADYSTGLDDPGGLRRHHVRECLQQHHGCQQLGPTYRISEPSATFHLS